MIALEAALLPVAGVEAAAVVPDDGSRPVLLSRTRAGCGPPDRDGRRWSGLLAPPVDGQLHFCRQALVIQIQIQHLT